MKKPSQHLLRHLVTAVTLTFLATATMAASRYTGVRIEGLTPMAMNNHGQVVGTQYNRDTGVSSVALWHKGVLTPLSLSGLGEIGPLHINDAGQVLVVHSPHGAGYQGLLWDQGRSTEVVIPGKTFVPGALGPRGEVAGTVFSPGAGLEPAALWHEGNVTPLGPTPPGAAGFAPFSLNAHGDWVGGVPREDETANDGIAMRAGVFVDGQYTELPGNLWGLAARHGTKINNQGAVLSNLQPGLWGDGGGVQYWHHGVTTVLDNLPVPHPELSARAPFGVGLNNHGQIVGGSNYQAFIWSPEEGLKSLASLTDGLDGLWLHSGLSINDPGQILVVADRGLTMSPETYLLLSPVPEPSVIGLAVAGVALTAWVSRRKAGAPPEKA